MGGRSCFITSGAFWDTLLYSVQCQETPDCTVYSVWSHQIVQCKVSGYTRLYSIKY